MKKNFLFPTRNILLAVFFLLPLVGPARTVSWIGDSGDWESVNHWNVGELPNANDDVVITGTTNLVVSHSVGDHVVKSIQCQRGFEISGGTLTVSNTVQVNGPFIFSGGTLSNATILAATNATPLVIKSDHAVLDHTVVNGTLDVGNTFNSAELTVRNGMILNGRVLVGNATEYYHGHIVFENQQTLAGAGKILIAESYFQSLGGQLTIGPNIKIEASNTESYVNFIEFFGSWNNKGTMQFSNVWVTFSDQWTNSGTISVDQGALNFYQYDGDWSNAGVMALTNSFLNLDGTFSLADWNVRSGNINLDNSFVCVTGTLNNSNTTISPDDFGGRWMLTGGTISEGTIVGTDQRPFRIEGFSGGVLDGVTLNGKAEIGQQGETRVTIQNGLALNGTVKFGNATNGSLAGGFIFEGEQTLSGTGQLVFSYGGFLDAEYFGEDGGVPEGDDTFTVSHNRAVVVGDGTFTIGNNISILTSQEIQTSLLLSGKWKNLGVINLTNAWLTLAGNWTNSGIVTLQGGSLAAFLDGPNWANAGLINLTNTYVSLDGNFSVADWNNNAGIINKTNVDCYLVGTLNNTNSTLRTDDLGGAWILRGGIIKGGIVQSIDGTPIIVEGFGNSTFDGVTVNGILDVGHSTDGYLTVIGGLILNGTAFIGNGTNYYDYGTISFIGDQTLSGNGTVILGNSGLNSESGTLTIGSGITIERPQTSEAISVFISGNWVNAGALNFTNAGDYIYLDKGWTNVGRINVSNGTLFFDLTGNQWANTGSINTTNTTITLQGTFTLAEWSANSSNLFHAGGVINVAGNLNNTNLVLTSDSFGGRWLLDGGSIHGGTLTSSGGTAIVATDNGGTLDGVAFNGTLDVGNTFDRAFLQIINGLTLNGVVQLGNPTNASQGRLIFDGTQTLNGNGTVLFGLPSHFFFFNDYDHFYLRPGTALTLGPGITVRGLGGQFWSDSSDTAVLNKGTISSEVAGEAIFVHLQSFTNFGTIKVASAATFDCSGDLVLGSGQKTTVQSGGRINVGGNFLSAVTLGSQISFQGDTVFTLGTHELEVVSKDLGNVPTAYVNNFGHAKMTLSEGAAVKLVNNNVNGGGSLPECVYVNSLVVPPTATLDLNGFHLYAGLSQIGGTIKNGTVLQVPDSGGTIAPGGISSGLLSTSGAIQQWKFSGKAGQRVTIAIDTGSANILSPALNYALVELFDPRTNAMAQASNIVAQQLVVIDDLLLPTNGIYTILIRAPGNASDANGNYSLAIWDIVQTTAPLALNYLEHGYIRTPYSVNEWTFSGVAGQEVRLNLKNSSTFGLQFDLRGPSGWIGFTNLSGSSDLVVLPSSGRYTLLARAGNDTFDINYAFILEEVSQTELAIGTVTTGELIGIGQAQLFHIVSTNPSPTQISLWLSNAVSRAEIYVRLGAPPTRSNYDYRSDSASGSLQNVLIPLAAPGDWYILIYGYTVPELTGYSLVVDQRRLFVNSSVPQLAGSAFETILTLTGAGFDSNSVVQLTSSSGSNFVAQSLSSVSWVKLVANFSPNTIPPGIYDVCTSAGGETVCLTNTLNVVDGGIAELHTRIIVPNVVGYHNPATIYVEYSNVGTAAMPAPLLTVSAVQNGQSRPYLTLDEKVLYHSYTTGDFHEFTHTVQILASGRVPGILQPGESYRIPVYYAGWELPYDFSYPPITFTIGTFQADNNDVIDWAAYAATMRPLEMTDAQWVSFLDNLKIRVGNTWGAYVTALSGGLNGVQPVAAPAYDAVRVFNSLAEQLLGYGHSTLTGYALNITTNQFLANVQIVARQALGSSQSVLRSTFSDETGHFAFTNLPAGTYALFVDGYVAATNTFTLFENFAHPEITLEVSSPMSTPTIDPEPAHTNESSPVLTVDKNGTPHAVWLRGSEIWHAYNNGDEWISTGTIPEAHGRSPVILSSSNLIDGNLPGLIVAWEEPNTNGSSLFYSVITSSNGNWTASLPSLLNETNNLQNQGLDLLVNTNGGLVAVWQKKQKGFADDADLYYQSLSIKGSDVHWQTNAAKLTLSRPILASTSKHCVPFDREEKHFNIKKIPLISGKYGFEYGGEFCGGFGCEDVNASLSGDGKVTVGSFFSVAAKIEGELKLKSDTEHCKYLFDHAAVALSGTGSLDIPSAAMVVMFPFADDPILVATVGARWQVGVSGNAEWQGTFSKPIRHFTTYTLSGGPYGKGILEVGPWEVEGDVSGLGSVSAEYENSAWKKVDVIFTIAFDGKKGSHHYHYERRWSETLFGEGRPALSTLSPVFAVTTEPITGTTNVYSGNPVLSNVASNLTDDGKPSLALGDGNTILATWIADSATPEIRLGSKVMVASFNDSIWGSPVSVEGSMGFNSDPRIGFDNLKHPLLVWAMATNSNLSLTNSVDEVSAAMGSNDVVFSVWNGTNWTPPAAIAELPGTESAVTVGQTTDGHLIAAWANKNGDTKAIYSSVWSGSNWTVPSMVSLATVKGPMNISPVNARTTLFWTQTETDTNNAPFLNIYSSGLDAVTGEWSEPTLFIARYPEQITPTNDTSRALSGRHLMFGFSLPSPPSDCCKDDPKKQHPPQAPTPVCTNNCQTGASQSAGSSDPNAKFGPAGYGPSGYIANLDLYPYTIEFENATNASAPAQQVSILDPLDSHLDWNSFELGEIAFGDHIISVPPKQQYLLTNIPMTLDGTEFEVEVEAGIDPFLGEVFANFYSVDYFTGLPPGVSIGFLPPEDGTGRGRGHVSYFIRPKANLPTGTIITNVAYIQFDQNPIISTDQVDPHDPSKGIDTNKQTRLTIDITPPTSAVDALAATQNKSIFNVCWSGTDLGAGIVTYDIYVATNGGPWSQWLALTTNQCLTFEGDFDQSYSFYSIAHDGAGNTQSTAGSAVSTTVGPPPAFPTILRQPRDGVRPSKSNFTFTVSAVGTAPLRYQWQFKKASIAGATNSAFTLSDLKISDAGRYHVIVRNDVGSTISSNATLTVYNPVNIITQPQGKDILHGEKVSLKVGATGTLPLTYQWYFNNAPVVGQKSPTLVLASVTGSKAGAYTVVVSNRYSSVTSSVANIRIVPPAPIILTPAENSRTNAHVVHITGTAVTNAGIIQVNLSLNGGATGAVIGTEHWETNVFLEPGTNVISVSAINAVGASKATVRHIFLVQTNVLTLVTNGAGTLKPNFAGSNLLEGVNYTITAIPAANNLFSNWIGTSLTSTNNPLVFRMTSNMVIQANFVTNRFLTAEGPYRGLFAPGDAPRKQTNSGVFILNVTSAGAVSGNMSIGSETIKLNGKFDVGGDARIQSLRRNQPTLTTILHLDWDGGIVIGSVTDGSFVADLMGNQVVLNSTNFAGRYTMIIPGSEDSEVGPFGTSYGTVSVDASGTIVLVGSLADGTTVSHSSAVSKNGWWPLYISLYQGKGSLWSWNQFTNKSITSLPSASWINTSNANKTALYRGGFTNLGMAMSGSLYVSTNQPLINSTNAEVFFDGGNLSQAFSNELTISLSNFFTVITAHGNTNGLAIQIDKGTGLVNGRFVNPSNSANLTKFKGVLLQGETNAAGYFMGTNRSGNFILRRKQ